MLIAEYQEKSSENVSLREGEGPKNRKMSPITKPLLAILIYRTGDK